MNWLLFRLRVTAIWMGLYPIYSEQKYLQKLPRWIPRWFDHAHSENIAAGLALAESLAAAKTDEDRVTFLTIPVKNALQHAGGITVDEPTAKLIAKNIVRTWQGQNPDAIQLARLPNTPVDILPTDKSGGFFLGNHTTTELHRA